MSPKIAFFGNTKYSSIGAEIINKTHPISLLVTISDRLVGRDRTLTSSPTKVWASTHKVPVLEADKLDTGAIEKIAKIKPAFLIVEDYSLILPKELLDIAKIAPLNIHHSLLPKFRGPSPAPFAILEAEETTGVSIIKMTEEVDAGDILSQKEYRMAADETTDSLLTKLNILGAQLIVEMLDNFHSISPTPQDPKKVTLTRLLTKQDGYFDIERPPENEKLDREIRAYYPWPNVWTKWKGKIVKFYPKGMVQMEGKNPVSLESFLNGYPDFPLKELL